MRFDNINRYEVLNVINDVLDKTATTSSVVDFANEIMESIAKGCQLVEVVRCKDCRWWDKRDGANYGYCHAAKHGYFSKHWEISIYRTYQPDFYCADGERRSE